MSHRSLLDKRVEEANERANLHEARELRDWVARYDWIPRFNIQYYLGVDGISMPLILLTTVLCFLAMLASWNIDRYVRGYCILFLLLETGMLGTFFALDFFLFYIFWEVMLLPMYFLIGVWGGPRREYAAIKFFLYTLLGSVFILIALLGFYFTDVRDFVSHPAGTRAVANQPVHTFDIVLLQRAGRVAADVINGATVQTEGMAAAANDPRPAGCGPRALEPAILYEDVPDHHVPPLVRRLRHQGAGVPVSHVVAGRPRRSADADQHDPGRGPVEDGRLRDPAHRLSRSAPGRRNTWRAGSPCSASSTSSMAPSPPWRRPTSRSSSPTAPSATWGTSSWASPCGRRPTRQYWSWGMNGAMFQMIAHGITSAGMFFLVGVLYDRAHHRDLNNFRGLYEPMPLYGGISAIIFFAAMGLPGMCGFVGEFMVILSAWNFHPWNWEHGGQVFAVLSALTVVLTAAYILWTLQRVYLGQNPAYKDFPDISFRELVCIVPLVVFAVLLGVAPSLLLSWMEPSLTGLVNTLSQLGG